MDAPLNSPALVDTVMVITVLFSLCFLVSFKSGGLVQKSAYDGPPEGEGGYRSKD